MATKKETPVKKIEWGDGTIIEVKKPNLNVIPGDSVVCPMPCYPVGEDGAQWKENEKKTGKRPARPAPKK